jgi:trans-aconitate methyltransferase
MSNRPVDPQSRLAYWEDVHTDKSVDGVSWWQSVPELSLDLVDRAQIDPTMPVIDVGAGWSTLVDHLLERGYTDLTAIDLSLTALNTVRERLGEPGAAVVLEVADVLDLNTGRLYALWHDRAVFHFLVDEEERDDYRASLLRNLAPGGWVVVATFGPDGPLTCSGLPIVRYSHAELAEEFAAHFEVVATSQDDHRTPWGAMQQFTALLLRRRD